MHLRSIWLNPLFWANYTSYFDLKVGDMTGSHTMLGESVSLLEPQCSFAKWAQFSSVTQLCPTLCDPWDCSPPGSSVHGDSPGKNTRVGCHSLLQRISPFQGLNLCLLHRQADSLPRMPPGKPHLNYISIQIHGDFSFPSWYIYFWINTQIS